MVLPLAKRALRIASVRDRAFIGGMQKLPALLAKKNHQNRRPRMLLAPPESHPAFEYKLRRSRTSAHTLRHYSRDCHPLKGAICSILLTFGGLFQVLREDRQRFTAPAKPRRFLPPRFRKPLISCSSCSCFRGLTSRNRIPAVCWFSAALIAPASRNLSPSR